VKGVRLVVFDLDGTLVDSSEDLARAVNAALERVAPGAPPLPVGVVRRFIGNGAGTLVARSLAAVGVRRPPEEVLPIFLACYGERLLDTTRLYPGVAEALEALSRRRLAVLTNKPGDLSRRLLEGLGVAHHFQGIYGGGDVPARKPDPAGLLKVLGEASAAREEALMVGDSAVDVLTGRSAGVRTAGVSYGLDPESLAEEPPDLMVDDLRDLARRLGA
jgi:phosphoglycolate phosphatase